MLTKSTDCQSLRKPASRGRKLAAKGAYINVSDCRMQVQRRTEEKIAPDFSFIGAIFAFAGFVCALTAVYADLKGRPAALRLPKMPLAPRLPKKRESASKPSRRFPRFIATIVVSHSPFFREKRIFAAQPVNSLHSLV